MKRHAMRHLHLILTLAPAVARLVLGRRFDCGKAAAPIEQAICADPELSLADFISTSATSICWPSVARGRCAA